MISVTRIAVSNSKDGEGNTITKEQIELMSKNIIGKPMTIYPNGTRIVVGLVTDTWIINNNNEKELYVKCVTDKDSAKDFFKITCTRRNKKDSK